MTRIHPSPGSGPDTRGPRRDRAEPDRDEALRILETALESPRAPTPLAPPRPDVKQRVRAAVDILGKRRRFLLNARSQLRASFMTTGVTLLLLVVINIGLQHARAQSAAEALENAPEIASVIESQNRLELGLVLAASAVLLTGVFFVTLLETHKTEGAAFNLERHLGRVRDGRLSTRIRLRKGDNLQSLEAAFNEMATTLHRQCADDADNCERLAEEASRIASPIDAEDLTAKLRQQAGQFRSRLS